MAKSFLKTILLVFKCLLVVLALILGIRAHWSLNMTRTAITYLFVYYILVAIIVFIYEFFWTRIGILFIGLWLSQFG